MRAWTLLKRETVLDTPWVTLYKDTVRTGNGILIEEYYTFTQFSTAMVLPITEEGNVVLVREYRHGCRDYVWQLPAGKIGDGETAIQAARRELLEETGYETNRLKLLGSWYISSIRMPDKQFVFVGEKARKTQGKTQGADETEEIEIKEVPFEKAVEMVLAGEIKDPHSCTAILWVERMKNDL